MMFFSTKLKTNSSVIPFIDQQVPAVLETATFALG